MPTIETASLFFCASGLAQTPYGFKDNTYIAWMKLKKRCKTFKKAPKNNKKEGKEFVYVAGQKEGNYV